MGKPTGRSNIHHLYWPRPNYVTSVERLFRDLPCNKVRLDIKVHVLLHLAQKPPTKPKRDEMLIIIDRHNQRQCACYEGGTNGPQE